MSSPSARLLYLTAGMTGHDLRFVALFAAAGYEVHYLALDTPPRERLATLPPGVHLQYWETDLPVRARTPGEAAALLPALHRILALVQPHVVHAGPVPTAGFLAALAGVHPLVVMSWGSDLLVDAGRGAAWAEASRTALLSADAFVADCQTVVERARDFAVLPRAQVVVLPWGTDLHRFRPMARPSALREEVLGAAAADAFLVLCTRSWEPIYGIDTLLESFRRAYDRNRRLRLVLLGGGSLAPLVERTVAAGGLHDVVHRPGPVSHDFLPEWFRAADLYASCAHSDGTSVSLLEAMASGLPVLVTDIPSNREWVSPGENGWLAPRGDANATAEELLQVSSMSEAGRRAMGLRNRQAAESRADWGRNAQRLLAVYEPLISSTLVRGSGYGRSSGPEVPKTTPGRKVES